MQLNVGIIASNIPTLKPLLNAAIGTTSGDRYNQFNDVDRLANATIGSGMKTPKPRKAFFNSVYTNTDEGSYEMNGGRSDTCGRTAKVNIYSVRGDRTSSEERILDQHLGDSNRIKCTTEVVVDNVKKVDISSSS
jgi:hypothetical protein